MAQPSSAEEILRKTVKEDCLSRYRDLSDSELRSIVSHNYTAIAANAYSGEAEGFKLLGEMDACNEILKKRETLLFQQIDIAHATGAALHQWVMTMAEKRKTAIMNLPFAASYHGQLVAAVLEEEDHLTAQQIRQWSDELSGMPQQEYADLLQGLVDEKILLCQDGVYSLLSLCTPELFITNPQLWLQTFGKSNTDLQQLYAHLLETKLPLTERDWIDRFGTKQDKDHLQNNGSVYRAQNSLKSWCKQGLLSKFPVADTNLHLYYLPMLGERSDD